MLIVKIIIKFLRFDIGLVYIALLENANFLVDNKVANQKSHIFMIYA